MLKILNKRERIILYITAGLTVFIILFNFLLRPALIKNSTLNKEINTTKEEFKKYLGLLNKKHDIKNKYNEYTVNFKLTGQKEGDVAINILSELENMARDSNIRIIDIRPTAQKSATLYKEIIVELKTEGEMEDCLKFIYNIENSFRVLTIKRLQITAKSNTPALEGIFTISQISIFE